MVKREVVWDDLARTAFRELCDYIMQTSPQQADKVKQDVIEEVSRLVDYPFAHPPDKYRTDKDQCFRAFEKHNFRISYFISTDTIRILRFRHVRRRPEEY
jgi:plasmid stabilization system protein ParE